MVPQQKSYYDLNVPLKSSSAAGSKSTSWTRKQLAQIYQTRLHHLGYSGVAFCHTTYSRLDVNKDEADAVLPWNDLLSGERGDECTFGRKTSNGMDIYRRINIVLEEVTDVSRLLLPSNDQLRSSIKSLLYKYDLVSLQPMNEPTLQNICELLPSGDNTLSIPVDIIVLEYATGSRGGYGLPYRIRKDNVTKAMDAGVTFEVCYATAMVDPKRRQGFMRTLTDFQSTYNSIQKKQPLLNKHVNNRLFERQCKVDQYPLLVSSGSRQNYSAGTDEGMVSLRSPDDVQFLARRATGGEVWIDRQFDCRDSHGKQNQRLILLSIADKVLMKARDRSAGVVSRSSKNSERKRKMERADDMIRAYIGSMRRATQSCEKSVTKDNESDDDSDGISNNLVDWLSMPIQKSNPAKTPDEEVSDAEDLTGLEPLSNEIAESKPYAEQKNDDKQIEDDDDDDLEDGYLAL